MPRLLISKTLCPRLLKKKKKKGMCVKWEGKGKIVYSYSVTSFIDTKISTKVSTGFC